MNTTRKQFHRALLPLALGFGLFSLPAAAVTFEALFSPTSESAQSLDVIIRLSATQAETANGTCSVPLSTTIEEDVPPTRVNAFAGSDYTDTSDNFTLSLPSGAASDVTDQFVVSIPLINDNLAEPEEGMLLIVEALGANCFGQTINDLLEDLVIVDDDPLVFAFSSDATVGEDGGSQTVQLELTNPGQAPPGFQASAIVSTQDGSAQAPDDYQATSDTLPFDDQITSGALSVNIVDDGLSESDETLSVEVDQVSAVDPDGFALQTQVSNDAQITIVDNDVSAGPSLGFIATQSSVLEGTAQILIDVIPGSAPPADVTVDFASRDGSATAPADYSPVSGTLTFPAGSSEPQTITVPIINDPDLEGGESFFVDLSNPIGATIDPAAGSHQVFIDDNDTNVSSDITFNAAPGETVTFSYTVPQAGASRNTQQPFSDVTVSGNGPLDIVYTATVPTNAVVGTSFQDAVEHQLDSPPPIDVFFQINVVAPAAGAEYSFTATTADVGEADGTVSLQVRRDGDVANSGEVSFRTVDGTATSGADYELTEQTLAFGPGENGPVTINVAVLDDGDNEGDETFTVELFNPLDGTVSPAAGVATVTITDDDAAPPPPAQPGTLQFTAVEVTVNEAEGTVQLDVSREGGAGGAASVEFTTVEDTALAGSDFTAASGTLNWADGDSDPKSITITLLADTDIEGIEEFSVQLSNPATASIGTPAAITVVVTDLGRDIAGIPGLSANQREMAGWFDANCERLISSNPTNADQQDLASVCQNLRSVGTTDQQVRDGLDAVNAEELATAATTTLRLLGDQHGNLQRRINGLRSGATGIDLTGLSVSVDGQQISGAALGEIVNGLTWGAVGQESDFGRWGFFVDGKVDFGDRDDNAANSGYDFDSTVITVGADYRVRDNFFIGAALGYADADVDFNGGGGLDFDSFRGSVYTTYFLSDRYYIDAMFSYGSTDYDSNRRIRFTDVGGTIDRTATGSTDGNMFTGGFGSGFDFSRGALTFGPNFGAYYFDVDVDAYSESGAGGLNLDIGDQNAKSFTVNVGGHASWVINVPWGVLIPNARFDLVHEFEDGVEQVGIRFAADPFANDPTAPSTPIIVSSEKPDENYFVWSVGASAQFVRGFSGFVNYQSTAGYSNLTLNEVSFGMRYEKTF